MLCTVNMEKPLIAVGRRRTELQVDITVGFGTRTRDLLSPGISCTVGWSPDVFKLVRVPRPKIQAVSNKQGDKDSHW